MTIADKPHGRSRYNAGCRCGECRTANRDHQRKRRSKYLSPVPAGDPSPPVEFIDGPVTLAVRAQLAGLPAAEDRPGLVAIAIRLAQLMDTQSAVPQFSAAAKVLSEIITGLTRQSRHPGRLTAVRSLTERE